MQEMNCTFVKCKRPTAVTLSSTIKYQDGTFSRITTLFCSKHAQSNIRETLASHAAEIEIHAEWALFGLDRMEGKKKEKR